jgi:pimeloyl-ACP methyl ester carboxylesterase
MVHQIATLDSISTVTEDSGELRTAPVLWSSCCYEASGISLRYRVGGCGNCLVWLESSAGFAGKRIHDILCERYLLIVIETPDSVPSSGNSSSGWYASIVPSVFAILRHYNVEHFSLIGVSYTFTLFLRIAAYKPAMVRGTVLLAPDIADLEDSNQRVEGANTTAFSTAASKTLVLFGTRDLRFSSQFVGSWRRILPNSYVVMVYGAGAEVDRDRPEAIAPFIEDFLNRKENFLVQTRSGAIYP